MVQIQGAPEREDNRAGAGACAGRSAEPRCRGSVDEHRTLVFLLKRLSAWLTPLQTRQKLKEAYDIHTAATIERAEKQIMLAKQARRILTLIDDTPIVPGDTHPAFDKTEEARLVLNDAEEDLRNWRPSHTPVPSHAGNLRKSPALPLATC